MKFSKKVLIGLLTATCAVAGTVGLAACQGNGNEPEQPEVTIGENGNVFVNGVDTGIAAKTDVSVSYVLQVGDKVTVYYSDGTSQEVPFLNTNLSVGTNEINLSLDALAAGLTYKFAPGKAGDYVISVAGDNAKVTVGNETVSGTYVATLAENDDVLEIKCATVDGKAGSYTINVNPVTVLSLTNVADIVLPKKGATAYYSVNIESGAVGAYTFDAKFNGVDAYSKYTFNVNGKDFIIGEGRATSFNATLVEGANVITLTSNLAADSSAILSIIAIPSGGTLQAGDNNITFTTANTFYAFTFTAQEDGDYTVSAPYTSDSPCTLCITTTDGTVLLSDKDWIGTFDDDFDPTTIFGVSFTAEAGETLTLLIKVDDDNLAASYALSVTKFVPPTINVSDKNVTNPFDEEFDATHTEINVNENGTKVSLNVETAGTYIVSVAFSVRSQTDSVSLNGHSFSAADEESLSLEIELKAGDNLVEFVYETANKYEQDITIWVNLTAKA